MIKPAVKAICKYKGIQLYEIADALKITRQSLHRFLTGSPNLETVRRIADALQVPPFLLLHPDPIPALQAWNARKDSDQADGRPEVLRLLCPVCGGRLQVEIRPDDSSGQDQQQPDDQTTSAGEMERPTDKGPGRRRKAKEGPEDKRQD